MQLQQRQQPHHLGCEGLAAGLGLRWPYFASLAVAGAIALWHYTLIRTRTREGCFRAFRLNHWLGFAVFAGVVGEWLLRAAR